VRKILAFSLIISVSACSGGNRGSIGSLNPFSWFNRADQNAERSIEPRRGYVQIAETRTLIGQVTGLTAERTPYGVIVRATGLAASQGYYSADLVQVQSGKPGELMFEFRARPPEKTTTGGSPHLREIVAATYLSRQIVRNIRQITVTGANNFRSTRP